MSFPPGARGRGSAHAVADKRAWLGRLSTYLASFAGGAAINDLSGTLGYHGLAGAVALLGVVAAASWIRGLDPRARLSRRAPWLFLTPAACAGAAAAFSSGTAASILSASAAILTIGAVLIARELQSAARLLTGSALIMSGAAVISAGTASIASGHTALGAAIIPAGTAFIVGGAAYIGNRHTLIGAALIAGGAAGIADGAVVITDRTAVNGWASNTFAIALIIILGAFVAGDGLGLVFGSTELEDEISHPGRKRSSRFSSGSYATMYAVIIAIFADGPARVAKGVTSNGSAHIVDLEIFVWMAFIAFFAAEGVIFAVRVGPDKIVSSIRRAIDWAIKGPV